MFLELAEKWEEEKEIEITGHCMFFCQQIQLNIEKIM